MKALWSARILKLATEVSTLAAEVRAGVMSASVSARVMAMQVEIGRFLLILEEFDTAQISDAIRADITKGFQDASAALDSYLIQATKAVKDSAGAADAHLINAGKALTDTAHLTDSASRQFTKSILDSVDVTDDVNGAAIGDNETMSFFKVIPDQVGVADTFVRRMDYGRPYSDAAGVSDRFSAGVAKGYAESLGVQDTFARQFEATRSFDEQNGVADHHSVGFFRTFDSTYVEGDYFLQDYLTNPDHYFVSDQYTHLLTKGPSDQVQLSDTINTKGATKPIEEGFGVHEVFSKGFTLDFTEGFFVTDDIDGQASAADDQTMSFTKSRNEQIVLTDSVVLNTGFYRSFEDLPHVQDLAALNLARSLSDTAGVASIHSIGLARLAADSAQFSDSNSKSFTKGPTEQAAVTDAGSLRSQGYCDFTYFAEDFVGSSRTF